MAKKHLFSWQGYYDKNLVSAIIADAAKQDVVLTFLNTVKPFSHAAKAEFTMSGQAKTVDSLTIDYDALTVTINVNADYANGNVANVVHNPAWPNKGATVTTPVTNNVA